MDLTIDNRSVIQGRLQLPARGPWWGEFTLDANEALKQGQRVTVRSATGFELVATVQKCEVVYGVPQVRIIGGRGGLNRTVAAQWHTGPGLTARTVLTSWADAAGEQLSGTIASELLSRSVARWVRAKGRSIDALDALADALGVNWRVLPDGTVWLGVEQSAEVEAFEHDVVARRVATGCVELVVDAPAAQLLPGRMFEGRKIGTVEYLLTPEKCRAVVGLIASTAQDTIQDLITSMVKRALWRERYRGLYRAEVVAVRDDWTVDLRPTLDEWPEMTEVPVLSGVAGASAKLARGAKVAFEFADSDPMQPAVTMWSLRDRMPSTLTFDTNEDGAGILFQGGSLEVARRTDPAKASAAMNTWMQAVETAINVLAPGAVPTLSPTFADTAIATIASGAPKVKA